MKAVLPGKPESRLQALATGLWGARRIIVYISGNAFAILSDHATLIQTVYDDADETLQAVAFDEASGKIATCTETSVRIYKPFGQDEDALRWALQATFAADSGIDNALGHEIGTLALSWAASEELLVARSALSLYQTASTPVCRWRKALASPAKLASLSYDSSYIASAGDCDRLVKVWRRLSYGAEDVRFDFAYLRHPGVVTGLQWRKPYHVDHSIEHVLYTFCSDNFLRIWTRPDAHSCHHLQLWGTVDLGESIQSATLSSNLRWAFIIQGRDLSAATEAAVQESGSSEGGNAAALRHLIQVANRSSEVCVVMDGRGAMSALSLENVGRKSQTTHDVFSIAQVTSKDLDFLSRLKTDADSIPHVEIYNYCNRPRGHLQILMHDFSGKIELFQTNIEVLLDETAKGRKLVHTRTWSGNSGPIRKIVRNFSGRSIVSRTALGECVIWNHALDSDGVPLAQQSVLPEAGHIHRICVMRKGRFVIFLFHDKITLWDCRQPTPFLLATCGFDLPGKPLCLLILPRKRVEENLVAHVATITSEKMGVVWEVHLPPYNSSVAHISTNGHSKPSIRKFYEFELPDAGDLAYVLPVDPAGSTPHVAGFLDVFARDVAISYTHTGRVEFWTARVDHSHERVDWLSTSSLETGLREPALVSGSTMKKAALVNSDRSTVTIWDIRGARLEYAMSFEAGNTVQDLDWTSTPDSQSILAVGFPHRVVLLAQMRFDYLNKGPAWASIREISIRDLTAHPIGDSTWLGDGHLVIGSGNQLFTYDRTFDPSASTATHLRLPQRRSGRLDLFEVVQRLNGPLPVFHPQFLSQCMLAGKSNLLKKILLALHKTLKYWLEGENIDDYLGLDLEEFYMDKDISNITGAEREKNAYFVREGVDSSEDDDSFNEEVAQAINEKLTRVALPQLSGHEQIQLVDIVECAGLVETQRRSMDENAARYMLFFRQHALRKGRTSEIYLSWREINWAYHSTSQDILVGFISRQHHGTVLWEHARESGMFMWLTDMSAVRAQFEIIARNEYTKSEMKNPVDCSLFYLALKKKTVLQGLWRMASWNREQGATLRLLSNNFDDPKWKTTALKNAYALMSKRRFEYAAAFFLLADHLQDAVNVCLNQLKDLQLAVAVARVHGGDQGPVLRKLLEEEVLTIASQEGNRWLASWAFWMLHRRDMAVRALITPVFSLLETPHPADIKSKLFLMDDPALVILYSQLRQKTLQTLRGASKVTPKVEWEFVLHSARLYDRMGCDLLGLDIEGRARRQCLPEPPPKMVVVEGRSFTVRGVLVGLLVGLVICFSNMYFGLQTGWVSIMSMPASLMGFGLFKALSRHLKFPFSPVENVLVQSVAGGMAIMPLGCGFVGVLPAMNYLLTPEERGPVDLSVWKLIVWSLGLCYFGVVFAVPLRRQVIIRERLKFPSGFSTAVLIGVLHGKTQRVEGGDASQDLAAGFASLAVSGRESAEFRIGEPLPDDEAACGSVDQGARDADSESDWKANLRLLFVCFLVSGLLTFATYFFPVLHNIPIFGFTAASTWLWTLNPSLAYVGQGIIMGPETTLHMLLGALLGWGVLSPLAKFKGWAPGSIDDWERGSKGWIVWTSLAIMLADAIISLGHIAGRSMLQYLPEAVKFTRDRLPHGWSPSLLRDRDGYTSINGDDIDEAAPRASAAAAATLPVPPSPLSDLGVDGSTVEDRDHTLVTDDEDAPPHQQVSDRVVWVGLILSIAFCIFCIRLVFGDLVPLYATVIAVFMALFLSIMGVRALGETDLNPVSGISKLAQLFFAFIIPQSHKSSVLINLVAGAVSEAGALQAGDLMQDLKTGHLLGAAPKAQFWGQVIGATVGSIVSAFIYKLYTAVYQIPGELFQVPTGYVWIFTARLVTGQGLPYMAKEWAMAFAAVFAVLTAFRIRNVGKSWRAFIPGGIAVAVGMYNVPSFTLARTIGGILSWYWRSVSGRPETPLIVLASGFILGEGFLSIVNLIMQSAGVPHL
ncbi:uncharacterized protein E0L32_004779 [Thyridium curvatum]|uniref:RAVE complex protein Rav1 C-terminal domain-containing protein n=1 Tax=Thyridium curvatum TaxID=1093900 RepID=A0A507BE40_9PEZI|nr:uncharacterized protein E0L32_004779 [Thyridium curvatum]TPX15221.1 hypothetical protein E0L32_004779 [Thyridium curvatum]